MCMSDYEILSGNVPVALWKNHRLTVYHEKLLPQYLKSFGNADMWLETRAVDSHRANSRLLKKALRMQERDDLTTVLRANGATVTDNYWVRAEGSSLCYEEVGFDEKYYRKKVSKSIAKLALSGNSRSFNCVAENFSADAAELTNIGSFEKCWKNIDGRWWMYKRASRNEAFSEIFIYHLCATIGISCATYEPVEKGVRTQDFTRGTYNFEPALTFMGEEEDYEKTITKIAELCPEAVAEYVRMIFLDALVFNPDRHTANFGLLRDKASGDYVGFAPCFDHNMALISKGYPEGKIRKDLLITLFCDTIKAHPDLKEFIPIVDENILHRVMKSTGMKVREADVIRYILSRYELIVRVLEEK